MRFIGHGWLETLTLTRNALVYPSPHFRIHRQIIVAVALAAHIKSIPFDALINAEDIEQAAHFILQLNEFADHSSVTGEQHYDGMTLDTLHMHLS